MTEPASCRSFWSTAPKCACDVAWPCVAHGILLHWGVCDWLNCCQSHQSSVVCSSTLYCLGQSLLPLSPGISGSCPLDPGPTSPPCWGQGCRDPPPQRPRCPHLTFPWMVEPCCSGQQEDRQKFSVFCFIFFKQRKKKMRQSKRTGHIRSFLKISFSSKKMKWQQRKG